MTRATAFSLGRRLACLLACWLVGLGAPAAGAATLSLNRDSGRLALATHWDMLEDQSGRLDINDIVQAEHAGRFQPLAGDLNVSYSKSVYWLRLRLQRSDALASQLWWLEYTPVMLDDVRLYQPGTDGRLHIHKAGDRLPFSALEMRHRYPLFRLDLPDSGTHVLYLRVQSSSAIFLRATLWTPQAFAETSNLYSGFAGLYYGIMLAMIVYNLLLASAYRDRALLYYLLLSVSTLVAGLSVNGHFGMLFAPDWPWLVDILPGLTPCLILVFSSLFVAHFLRLRQGMPRMFRLLRAFQLFFSAAAVLVLAGYNHLVAPLVQSLGFLQMLLILPLCLLTGLRGYRPGYIAFAASGAWVIGTVMLTLRNLGWLASSWASDYGFQTGSALEVILLALAQAERIRLMRKERALTQAALLKISQRGEQQLEAKVARRTAELAAAVTRLQQLDKEKNDFLGIAAHDLKNPLTSIIGMSELLQRLAHHMPDEQRQQYLERIGNSGRRMMNIITNLLDINAFESGHAHYALQAVDLGQALREVLQQYEDSLRAKDLQVELDQHGPLTVRANPDALAQIFDNLISNAAKYSSPGQRIWLSVGRHGEFGRCRIRDQGPGLSVQDQQRLFERYTRLSAKPTAGEHSSGLGLSIVKKLCSAMGGRVTCQSEIGAGCTFSVDLPLAAAAAAGQSQQAAN
ncbi:MAG: sensor histidine kinase [Burkholderiales bacterium]|nr:sensor histidine kinase [Burkholderiales bacterium]